MNAAVEHFVKAPHREPGAAVLDALFRVKEVVADLRPEADFRHILIFSGHHLLALFFLALEQASAEADLAIVSCHWGTENTHELTNYQKNTAHQLMYAGADLVSGHHPHVLQGVE
jgi:poly-gamma-glutamate capsule biosynthesis protein CapA/YwtB (metallophosphatase superfamily)